MHRQVMRLGRRILIAVVGGIVIVAGVILAMPLVPGPGIALILLGLGILSLEFQWPRIWLANIKTRGLQLKQRLTRKRAGIAFIGWAVLLVPLAIVAFAGIKLAPLYMTQFKVAKALEQSADTTRGDTAISPQAVLQEIVRRFDIEGIEEPTLDDVVVEKEANNWVVLVDYTRETTLLGSISLLVHFNKRVVLQ